MSNVSNVHQFKILDKKSAALSGQRLIRLIAKKSKDGTYENSNLQGSLCVSVPHVAEGDVIDAIDKLLPHVVAMVKDTQDKIVREWRITHGRSEIPGEVFDVPSVIRWLDDNATSDRFTTEYLQEWFMADYADVAHQFIRSAIDGAAQEIIDAKTNVLRDMFAGFASGRYSPNIPQCKAMIRFAQFASDKGGICGRMDGFYQKCEEIKAKKEAELSDNALGF